MRTLCILGLFGALFILYNGHILMNMSMSHHQSVHTSQKQVPSHAPQAASRESRQSMALRAPSSLPYNLQDNVGPYWSQNGPPKKDPYWSHNDPSGPPTVAPMLAPYWPHRGTAMAP